MQIKLDLYVKVYIVQAFFYWKRGLKPHTALLVVCLLGQKNWVIMSRHFLSSMQFLLFLMGKIFIKPFSPKPRGVFCNILVLVVVPSQRLLLPFSSYVLRPPKGCLTQQSTSLVVLEKAGGGFRVQSGCSLFL